MEYYAVFEKMQSLEESDDSLDLVSARYYTLYDAIAGDYLMNWQDKGYKAFLLLHWKNTVEIYHIYRVSQKLSEKLHQTIA